MSYRAQHKFPHGVYVIGEWDGSLEDDGVTPVMSRFLKVGLARDVSSRLAQLQTANPRTLLLLDWREFPTRDRALEVERAVHAEMSIGRRSGEWFEATAERACHCLDLILS